MELLLELLVVVAGTPILVLWLVIPKHSTETSIEFEKCLEQLSWTKCITYLRQLFRRSSTQSRTIQNRTEWHNRAKRWKACSLSRLFW